MINVVYKGFWLSKKPYFFYLFYGYVAENYITCIIYASKYFGFPFYTSPRKGILIYPTSYSNRKLLTNQIISKPSKSSIFLDFPQFNKYKLNILFEVPNRIFFIEKVHSNIKYTQLNHSLNKFFKKLFLFIQKKSAMSQSF